MSDWITELPLKDAWYKTSDNTIIFVVVGDYEGKRRLCILDPFGYVYSTDEEEYLWDDYQMWHPMRKYKEIDINQI